MVEEPCGFWVRRQNSRVNRIRWNKAVLPKCRESHEDMEEWAGTQHAFGLLHSCVMRPSKKPLPSATTAGAIFVFLSCFSLVLQILSTQPLRCSVLLNSTESLPLQGTSRPLEMSDGVLQVEENRHRPARTQYSFS